METQRLLEEGKDPEKEKREGGSYWSRKWQPASVFLPGKFHERGVFWGYKNKSTYREIYGIICMYLPYILVK